MFVRGYENSIFAWYVNCDTPKEDPFFGDKSDCAERNISLSFRYYNSYEGRDQPSGAYVFRPENGTIDTKPYGNYIGFGCYNESDWLQTFQILTDKGSIFMRMIKGDRLGLQVETQFGGIELSDVGTEVTLNIKALGFNNSQQFYTDSNGLQFQYRKIDYRPTWNVSLTETEHISGNYYPINSAITMIDNYRGEIITYLNDRSQGGSALKADRLELMIDRRLYVDDEKGVGEALNETDIHGNPLPVTTHGILLLERSIKNYSNLYGYSRIKAAQRRLASTTVVGIFDTSNDILSNSIYQSYPSNSNSSFIIQVYPVAFDEIIVRLENPEDYLTHPNMTYINYDINAIAKSIYEDANSGRSPAAIKIQEVALSASETSQEREKHRLSWKVEENKYSKSIEKEEGKLHRQEMKTFRIKYAHNNDEAIQATF